jgi:asparagine synthetase B (glutamine-hydrolysing)
VLSRLDPIEVHSGVVLGLRRSPLPAAPPEIPGPPRRVLEQLLIQALSDAPCYVLFSGGRDSSVMLAAATETARKHGLPEPIALTARFSAYRRTWENEWQERTIRHLALEDWIRFEAARDLDLVGEIATAALLRHGPFWPANAHTMLLFARQAGAGTMLTGGGGDELFGRWAWARLPLREVARMRPRRRVVKWGPYNCLPLRLRQRLPHRSALMRLRWLTEAGHAQLHHRQSVSARSSPATWSDAVEEYIRSRYLECLRSTLDTLVASTGARLVEPFYDVRLMRAVVSVAPDHGFAGRDVALTSLFGDLLPADVLRRSTKAEFSETLWGPAARAFATRWDGGGVDPDLVDVELLRAEWLRERPDGRAAPLMQRAWCAQRDQLRRSASRR